MPNTEALTAAARARGVTVEEFAQSILGEWLERCGCVVTYSGDPQNPDITVDISLCQKHNRANPATPPARVNDSYTCDGCGQVAPPSHEAVRVDGCLCIPGLPIMADCPVHDDPTHGSSDG
ncbi:hypothetical protein LCGC14_1369990 [marine sediment metagenome]|uniref:Uncharacterized protein n=1 Tax=marine sediment metagenome TaxID=412755 RepID=A0A0F9MKW4_9ZZZZ